MFITIRTSEGASVNVMVDSKDIFNLQHILEQSDKVECYKIGLDVGSIVPCKDEFPKMVKTLFDK
jgi:hypothetical protein